MCNELSELTQGKALGTLAVGSTVMTAKCILNGMICNIQVRIFVVSRLSTPRDGGRGLRGRMCSADEASKTSG